jgi:hypothetical protein
MDRLRRELAWRSTQTGPMRGARAAIVAATARARSGRAGTIAPANH